MNSRHRVFLIVAAFLIFGASTGRYAYAAPPEPGCSMLAPSQIQKIVGRPFGAPVDTKALPAYAGQSWGSNCSYASQTGGHSTVTFIVYVDASAAEAKQTFEKLSAWYTPKSKPPVGDSAYIDKDGAIHVLKGKVRYYISLEPKNEKQMTDLATSIAARI